MNYVWILLFIAFTMAEAFTPVTLVSIWFAVGSLAGLLASALKLSVPIQIAVFIIVSVVFLVVVNILYRKHRKVSVASIGTVVGRKALVVEPIDNVNGGKIYLDGSVWTAYTVMKGEFVEKDEHVRVVRTEGSKAYVKKINN